MEITNRHKLPRTIVNAIKQVQSEYSGGSSDLSASGLTKPVRIFWLERRHAITQDASELIWSLIGTLVHSLLEKAAEYTENVKAEERLFKEILGWVFSGQYDLVEDDVLYDYKVTSIWAVLGEPKLEWIAQANANRLLLHEAGVEINKLAIIAILRDWSKAKSKFDKNYPNTQIKRVNLPMWSLEDTQKYLEERVALLQTHEDTPDDELPPCTSEERWAKPTVYAVYKDNKAKRATKLFDNEIDAKVMSAKIKGRVEVRHGEDTRCLSYCSVCNHCSYWKENYE